MALEQLVNGMTGQQLANTIKNNFDKVLDVESAENKAENAGKALKTDYDATRYVEMELADGTPIRMRWDVFCQAIASVVAGNHGMKITCKHNVQTSSLTETDLGSITNGIVILIPSAFQSAASIVTVNSSSVDYIKKHDGTTFRCADGSLYASFTSGIGVCKYIKIQFDYEL